MVIKRIGVWSLARMLGGLNALLGLIFGACLALLSLVGAGLDAGDGDESAMFGVLFGAGAVIFLPIFYGVLGLAGGALTAAIYNVVAGMFGGVAFDVDAAAPRVS